MSGLDIEARLRLTPEEAAKGGRREVRVMRFVRCTGCTTGCSACTDGLTTREEKLTVTVPAGITNGTKLRLANKGHASTKSKTGDCFLTVDVPQPRPASPAASSLPPRAAPAAPASAPLPVTSPAATWRRERLTRIALIVAATAAAFGLVYALAAPPHRDLGASCKHAGDCPPEMSCDDDRHVCVVRTKVE